MTARRTETVVILGTTLASLVAAYELARQGCRLTIIDHPHWADDLSVSETVLGCHHAIHTLLRAFPEPDATSGDKTISPEFRLPDGRIVSYRPTTLPGSLHWIAGLVRFRGLSWNDRWQLLSYLERIWEQDISIPTALDHRTADTWLASIGQSQSARETIWAPLLRFLTGNALTDLSAAACARILGPPFLTGAHASRCTRLDSSRRQRLHEHLRTALRQLGADILTQPDLPHIQFEQHRIAHLRLCDGQTIHATWFLSGITHHALLTLLPDRLLTRYSYFSNISELTDLPAVSIQLTGPAPSPATRLILLPGPAFQSVITSATDASNSAYELWAVGDTSFIERTDTHLITLAKKEIRALFPAIRTTDLYPTVIHRRTHATLSLKADTAILRPIQQSPIQNFLVAGSWTDTGWPDNCESAVVSAYRCAATITGATS